MTFQLVNSREGLKEIHTIFKNYFDETYKPEYQRPKVAFDQVVLGKYFSTIILYYTSI